MYHLVIFDNYCMLCSRFIDFLLRHDKEKQLWFAPNDSARAKELIVAHQLKLPPYNSIIFATGDKVYTQSDAVIHIFRRLGGIWRIAVVFRILPKRLRDYAYGLVARSRYTIFGKKEVCEIGGKKDKSRILN